MRTGRNHRSWLLALKLLLSFGTVTLFLCLAYYSLLVGISIVLIFAAFLFFLRLFETNFIFFPAPYPEGDWQQVTKDENVEELFLKTSDGERINGFFFSARGEPKATILFFHGNAGNMTHRFQWCQKLCKLQLNILAIDYRGYGKSSGEPSEVGLYKDGVSAYDYLVETRGIKPQTIVLYGKSLGGGPATELATTKMCGGLILQSTFTSIGDMAATILPLIPLGLLLKTKFDTNRKLFHCTVPVLVLHSEDDELIPVWMAKKNGQTAPKAKTKLFVGADHNGLISTKSNLLLNEIASFIATTAYKLELS